MVTRAARAWGLIALLLGCSSTSADPPFEADDLRRALEADGFVVTVIGSGDGDVLGVDGPAWWCVDDVVMGVYEFESRSKAREKIDWLEDETRFAAVDYEWPLYFFARDRIIVEVLGEHGALAPTLEDVFGNLIAAGYGFDQTLTCAEFRT